MVRVPGRHRPGAPVGTFSLRAQKVRHAQRTEYINTPNASRYAAFISKEQCIEELLHSATHNKAKSDAYNLVRQNAAVAEAMRKDFVNQRAQMILK